MMGETHVESKHLTSNVIQTRPDTNASLWSRDKMWSLAGADSTPTTSPSNQDLSIQHEGARSEAHRDSSLPKWPDLHWNFERNNAERILKTPSDQNSPVESTLYRHDSFNTGTPDLSVFSSRKSAPANFLSLMNFTADDDTRMISPNKTGMTATNNYSPNRGYAAPPLVYTKFDRPQKPIHGTPPDAPTWDRTHDIASRRHSVISNDMKTFAPRYGAATQYDWSPATSFGRDSQLYGHGVVPSQILDPSPWLDSYTQHSPSERRKRNEPDVDSVIIQMSNHGLDEESVRKGLQVYSPIDRPFELQHLRSKVTPATTENHYSNQKRAFNSISNGNDHGFICNEERMQSKAQSVVNNSSQVYDRHLSIKQSHHRVAYSNPGAPNVLSPSRYPSKERSSHGHYIAVAREAPLPNLAARSDGYPYDDPTLCLPYSPVGLPYVAPTPVQNNPYSEGFQSVLMYEFKNNAKSRRYELVDIYDHVAEFSGDQHGSRFIQTKLETANSDEKERIFGELQPNLLPLMTDVFGNYVIQKLFEHGDQTQKKILAQRMYGHVLSLSLQMYGCRVVQKALDHLLVDEQARLVHELQGNVLRCVKDQNGNHVVQKAIERCPAHTIGFIVEAFHGHVRQLSIHPYGCRVIQRCLEHCEQPAQESLMTELIGDIPSMIPDSYGNYVVQNIVSKSDCPAKRRVLEAVANNLEGYSRHKFASNVVEKCLEFGDDHWRRNVLYTLLGNQNERLDGEGILVSFLKDSYGNYVIQKLLDTLCLPDYLLFVNILQTAVVQAKRSGCGKQIMSIEKKMHRYAPTYEVAQQNLMEPRVQPFAQIPQTPMQFPLVSGSAGDERRPDKLNYRDSSDIFTSSIPRTYV